MTPPRTRLPVPGRPADVELGPSLEVVRRTAPGQPGADLLHDVSVARAATVLVEALREATDPVRTLLAGLAAFRDVQPDGRLEPVLDRAWQCPRTADGALARFAHLAGARDDADLARLGFGPKIWFTTNGVPVTWRPLTGPGTVPSVPPAGERAARPSAPVAEADRREAAREALAGAGLSAGEVLRVQLGDLGRLAPGSVFVPDLLAEPLLVRFVPEAPLEPGASPSGVAGGRRLAVLPHRARIAVLSAVLTRHGLDAGCRQPHMPVLTPPTSP